MLEFMCLENAERQAITCLFSLCAVHTYNLEGASPLWGSVVTNHKPRARVSVVKRNLKEAGGKIPNGGTRIASGIPSRMRLQYKSKSKNYPDAGV